jgi:prenyltransferase/squalene oxidase-like repeat protein
MAMNTPQRITHRWSLRALGVLGLSIAALLAWTASAGAYVTPAQAEHAADRGANWFQANQEESGSLGSDWAMTALAAADINAADVSTSLADPSAQDFYLDEWQATGPGGAGTDAARGILSGVAGGIQPSRLSASTADTTTSNLVARIAELFDGTQIGEPGLLNDDIFGLLALHQAGAPQPILRELVDYLRTHQHADGGWTWNASPSAPADTDMTGSVVAAFCAAGVSTNDPDLQQAFALLHSLQDPATGGFIAPPESFGIGVNTDTTAWVASGLIQCGIDPQSPQWTTDQGKTPLDYLVSLQRPDGHFDWTEEFAGGPFETYGSVRPLGGIGFSTAAPARLDGTSPAVRPVAGVSDGTTVPITLVIDHGSGADDVRMCRVDVESGSGLAAALGDAEASSTPAGCIDEFATTAAAGDVRVTSLNGVAETAEYGWRIGLDGAPPQEEATEPVGFGDLVFLEFAATVANPGPAPRVDVPPLKQARRQRVRGPRVAILPKARWKDGGAITVRLRCPRGNGAQGCRGTLTIQFRSGQGDAPSPAGSAPFEVPSRSRRAIAVPASAALQQALAQHEGRWLRITAATRDEDGAVRLTHARRFLAG